ncbi:MAG: 3-hydroxyacyl-CoA dehydrogenase NAD-binding domain-containing protein [Bacteroidota bacterium]|nr:3-hydroxyacyl-CoA dehydrogenase NAD-binding domain-containing protein [Bacteroidota bacterium]
MEINTVAVIGGGTMGNGIAHIFALNKFDTYLIEQNKEAGKKALSTISTNLDRQIAKELITTDEKQETLSRIMLLDRIDNQTYNSDLYIEAIYENKTAKLNIYKEILNNSKAESIIATNTSSLSITELAPEQKPDKFIGMHFMNPVPMMKLVEIIRGYSTSESTYQEIRDLAIKLSKEPVEVFDYPGFVSNRILMPMINEAIFCLMEGVASAKDIDTVMKLGMNHPMGPLALADFIGLDICLDIMNVLYSGYNDSKYRACPLLKKMVAAKKLGKKTGEGFYKYI